MNLADAVEQRFVLSFSGTEAPAEILDRVRRAPIGGFALFRAQNLADPGQVRSLTAVQRRAATL